MLLCALLFAAFAAWSIHAAFKIGLFDVRAFYCGGAVVDAGDDPYRVEPLRTCEHGGDITMARPGSGSVSPVPLPGYDLAFLGVLAKLPYPAAALLWEVALWIAVGAAALALWQLTGIDLAIVIAALLLSDGYLASFLGQIAPFAVAGIALAAWCASRARFPQAALCTTFAMCEPHLPPGSFLALALFAPAARAAAAAGAVALGALTLAATGLVRSYEYVHEVLPRHALSEVTSEEQLSLTGLLHLAGLSDRAAVLGGELWYAAFLVAGIVVAARLAKAYHDDAFLVVIPAACAVFGGTFVHASQMAAAIPATLLLYAKMPQRRVALGLALLLLCIPWTAFLEMLPVLPVEALAFGFLAWNVLPNRRLAAVLTVVQLAGLIAACALFHVPHGGALTAATSPTAYSEDDWRLAVDAVFSHDAAFFLPLKLPTWCGLAIVLFMALTAAWKAPTKDATIASARDAGKASAPRGG
ncbi:MAG TPA: glycosyltransferase 87 family protein [Candidatus Acidoferrales bacterium]|nr:glycosyltransferase 87 family protein [Candidatus Acidoferrales bacterium]